MRISPRQLQLVFHRGAKVKEQPQERIISDEYNLLIWKENDRALLNLQSMEDIRLHEHEVDEIIKRWIYVPAV